MTLKVEFPSANAGLPEVVDGDTVYDLDACGFAQIMSELCVPGPIILGGCCGTTPEYIRKLRLKTADCEYRAPVEKNLTVASSYTHGVIIGEEPKIVGERINPTGKARLKEALRKGDISYILSLALEQAIQRLLSISRFQVRLLQPRQICSHLLNRRFGLTLMILWVSINRL